MLTGLSQIVERVQLMFHSGMIVSTFHRTRRLTQVVLYFLLIFQTRWLLIQVNHILSRFNFPFPLVSLGSVVYKVFGVEFAR